MTIISKKNSISYSYEAFAHSAAARQWKRLGLFRRAGVSTPLFSLYSKDSLGIGELPDLKLLMDWCVKTGMSIIQLLPMNDVGFDFRPYDAQSSFALEPVYLSLKELKSADTAPFENEIQDIKKKFPAGCERVNYGLKRAKLEILKKIFLKNSAEKSPAFKTYCEKNKFWLPDYALYKVIKEVCHYAAWEAWPEPLKTRQAAELEKIIQTQKPEIEFHKWLQWQLFEQFSEVRQAGLKKGIYLMGDLPFLVSRDSADVWKNQDYFKMNLVAGAPPDAFFAMGQRWGMPPYDWAKIAEKGYDYLIEKLKYAENFYDLFRIDHVVGAFRIWTIPADEPRETHGLKGCFDPADESVWENHGRTLLSIMVQNTEMLPCAEDLGVVPEAARRVLEEFGIPGMEVQRWTKEWQSDASFREPAAYRAAAMAVISNHDMTSFPGWWEFEAGTVDGELFDRKCREKNLPGESLKENLFDLRNSSHGRLRWRPEICDEGLLLGMLGRPQDQVWDFVEMYRGSYDEKKKFWSFCGFEKNPPEKTTPELLSAAMTLAAQSKSIFSIQLLQDLLDLGPLFEHHAWDFRINFPGSTSEKNWSLVIPKPLEIINQHKVNAAIRAIHQQGGRI